MQLYEKLQGLKETAKTLLQITNAKALIIPFLQMDCSSYSLNTL
jgi:hypothetical protein